MERVSCLVLRRPCQPQDSYLVRMKRLPGTAIEPRQQILWDGRRRLLFTTILFQKPGSIALVSECHTERAYSPLQVARRLEAAGFTIRDILDARTLRIAAACQPRRHYERSINYRALTKGCYLVRKLDEGFGRRNRQVCRCGFHY